MFSVFFSVFLGFLLGSRGVKHPWCFGWVFLGFYLNTKEWKIRVLLVSKLCVLWSLQPQNRAAAATCGCGRCELPAILRLTPKIASGQRFFFGRRSQKPCDFCSGMAASIFAATMVTAILRCDFCAAKLLNHLFGFLGC